MYHRTLLLLFTVLVAVCGQIDNDDHRQSGNPLIDFFEAPLKAFKVQQGEAVAVFEPEVVKYNDTGIGSWLRRQGLVGSTGSLTNWLTRKTPSTTAKPVQTIYIQEADIVNALPNRQKPQNNNNNNNNNNGNNNNNRKKNKKKKPVNNGNQYTDNYDDTYDDYEDYYDDYDGDYNDNKPSRYDEDDDYGYDQDEEYYDDVKPNKAKPNKNGNRPSKYNEDQYDDDGYVDDYDEENDREDDEVSKVQTVRRNQNRRKYPQQNRNRFNRRRGGNRPNRRRQQNFRGQNSKRKNQQFQNNNFANAPNKPKRQRPTTRPLRAPQRDQVVVLPLNVGSLQQQPAANRPNRNKNKNKNKRPNRPQSDFVPMNNFGSIAFIPNGEPIPLSDENGTPIVPYNPLIPNPPFLPLNRTELLLLAGQAKPGSGGKPTNMRPQGGNNKNKNRRCKNKGNKRRCRRPNPNNQNQNQNNKKKPKPQNNKPTVVESEGNKNELSVEVTDNTPMEVEKQDDSDSPVGDASEEDAHIPLEGRGTNFYLPQRYFPLLGSDSYLAVSNNGRFLLKSARELRHVEDEANLEGGAVKAVEEEVLGEVKKVEDHPEEKPEVAVELKEEVEVTEGKSVADESEKTEIENATSAPPVAVAEVKSVEAQQETLIPVHVINPLPIEDHDAKPKSGGQVTLVHPVDTSTNAKPEEKNLEVAIVNSEPAVKSEVVAEETLPEPVPVQSPVVESEKVSPVEQP